MNTLNKLIFSKHYWLVALPCIGVMLFLWAVGPMFGLERAHLVSVGVSVDDSRHGYLGRKENLYVFENGEHVATLELPKELRGYVCFAVLSDRILFEKPYEVMWQSSLDLTDVQRCSDQKEARSLMNREIEIEEKTHLIEGDYMTELKSRKPITEKASQDGILGLAVMVWFFASFIHGVRIVFLARKLDRNTKWGRHPNWDD